ncbi:UvrD-helicase domain-containing protein [Pseudochryseolinea flava]|uniref:UvrD-helicase domain-containing protein n=1 Tax=Pseudochryseolinea flava TaxID=2059302 RepID=UPI001057AE62|nr:UvrD-helicase domain-containing protein [Pseudochryseolinea flava]
MSKPFIIYRSSAGSGKTRTLAKEYLLLALRFKSQEFKHVLAVTFTNKATQEMKDRILGYLNKFANGVPDDLAEELKRELNLDDFSFQQQSLDVLQAILHGYSQFSISTIDAFFQKVIRSFTREAGLAGDYRLEISQDEVLVEVIDDLIDELGSNQQLTEWVVRFALDNLENERAWDIRRSLGDFAKEIFKEGYKSIEDEVETKITEPNFFNKLLPELLKTRNQYVGFIREKAGEVVRLFDKHGFEPKDFKYAAGGVSNVFRKLYENNTLNSAFIDLLDGARISNEYQKSANWGSDKSPHRNTINNLAAERLIAVLNEVVDYAKTNLVKAVSTEIALNEFYSFGLIADLSRKLREYKNENNLMLLADAPKFLNGVIQDSDTPFIYEKVGSFYRNYLIDEFQDTSGLQWKNFFPLLANSLDQGYRSLLVGDVKQAIYRWRGGDLRLLQEEVEAQIGKDRIDPKLLDKNYRSSAAVIYFNNALFKTAAAIVSRETSNSISDRVYQDVAQQVARPYEGFVQVQFVDSNKDDDWRATALESIPALLEKLQDTGVRLKDIALLVRRREEGQDIVKYLIDFKNSDKAKPNYQYDVVSNESLRVDGAATVRLITAVMRFLLNPEDDIARAEVAYEYHRIHKIERVFTEMFSVTNQTVFDSLLPPSFGKQKAYLKKLPLFELTEALIRIFELEHQSGEFAYMQAFQDAVLKFSTRERNDLGAFLEYWEAKRHEVVIKVPDDIDGAQILTIHKSKGLQFKYVIIPFCSWKLDHENMREPKLWVKSNEPPFNQAGYIPVKYSSRLKNSYFKEFYDEEFTRSYLDNLNLLYVALTRAEVGLLVMAPLKETWKKGTAKAVTEIPHLLYNSIIDSENLAKDYDIQSQLYRVGTQVAYADSKTEASAAMIHLSDYHSSAWSDKLVIRQSAKEFFQGTSTQRDRINYGIHLHAILSRMHYAEDMQQKFDDLVAEGMIAESDKANLKDQLDELLKNPEIASWFSKEWEVRTEVPIILPAGVESRIDRLMIRNKRAVVVDFKTGEPQKTDQRQVLDYIDTLKKMNFTEVEGFLLYVKSGELVSVVQKKVKAVKKKDDQQLGLGL